MRGRNSRDSFADNERLMQGYDVENQQYSLGDLTEDSEEETHHDGSGKRTSFDDIDRTRASNSRTPTQSMRPKEER